MLSIQQRPLPINRTTLIAAGIVLVGFTGTLAVLKSTTSDDQTANVRDTSSRQTAPEATGSTTSVNKSASPQEESNESTVQEGSTPNSQPAASEPQSTNSTWGAPDSSTNTTQSSDGQPAAGSDEPTSSPAAPENGSDSNTTDPILPVDPLLTP